MLPKNTARISSRANETLVVVSSVVVDEVRRISLASTLLEKVR